MNFARFPLVLRLLQWSCVLLLWLGVGTLRDVSLVGPSADWTQPALPASVQDRPGELQVTLRDEAGHAIAGAQVRAFSILGGRPFLGGAAQANAQGFARIGQLPVTEHWITAEAQGRARAQAMVMIDRGARSLELTLYPEHRLTVRVRDEAGAPLSGITVEVDAAEAVPWGASTQDNGVAEVTRLREGPYSVRVRAPGRGVVSRRAVPEGQVLDIVMPKQATLVVHVADANGAKVPGAKVLVSEAQLGPARSADTNAEGLVRIVGLDPGAYSLRALKGRAVSRTDVGVPLAKGEEREVTLVLADGRSVDVHVTEGEAEGAEPVRGARVTLVEAGISPFPLDGVTDARGHVILGPVLGADVSASASADGFVRRSAVPVGEQSTVRLSLSRAAILRGRVRDARGFAVDGASLEISGTDLYGGPVVIDGLRESFQGALFAQQLTGPRPLVPMGELGVVPGPVPAIPRSASGFFALPTAHGPAAPSRSNAWLTKRDGTFEILQAPAGRLQIFARHPQFVEGASELFSVAPGAEANVDIVLRQGGSIEGRVVDTRGHGVPFAQVLLIGGVTEKSVRTADDGSFAFASAPAESTLLTARKDSGAGHQVRTEVTVPEAGRATVRVVLPEERPAFVVRVRDQRGDPIDAAQITATSLDVSSALRLTVFTDPKGVARVPDAQGLPLRIEVRAAGKAPRSVQVLPQQTDAEVRLVTSESLTGRVRDRRGNPIADADLAIETDGETLRTRTDRQGVFMLRELGPGPVLLRVRAKGFASKALPANVAERDGRGSTEVPPIELSSEGVVTGVVSDVRGRPIAGARVGPGQVASFVAKASAGFATTDASGTFTLSELPEGVTVLEAVTADGARGRVSDVRVLSDRTTSGVRITVDPKSAAGASPEGNSVAVTLGETGGPEREVVIADVAAGSEAERAGLRPGDVLLTVDGAKVERIEDARAKLTGPAALDVLLKLRRGDRFDLRRVPREPTRR
jgi:hypothetical protein